MREGRELDTYLAEKIMGWTRQGDRWIDKKGNWASDIDVFRPSAIESYAMELLNHMRQEWYVTVQFAPQTVKCRMELLKGTEVVQFSIRADTFAMAVARCAEQAAEWEEENHG